MASVPHKRNAEWKLMHFQNEEFTSNTRKVFLYAISISVKNISLNFMNILLYTHETSLVHILVTHELKITSWHEVRVSEMIQNFPDAPNTTAYTAQTTTVTGISCIHLFVISFTIIPIVCKCNICTLL